MLGIKTILIRKSIYKHSKKPIISFSSQYKQRSGICWACGTIQQWVFSRVINDELAQTWGLDKQTRNAFDARESMNCPNCKCSFRLRQLAESLSFYYGGTSLMDLVDKENFSELKIAEINSCGNLHQFLKKLPNLLYSEYGSNDTSIPSENLESLSYPDKFLDLILTSDTLEHVPDASIAMDEINRVLKPGGKHIFTVPVIWCRQTVKRAMPGPKNSVNNLIEPSYHGEGQPDYLVFSEFGYDITRIIEKHGYKVDLFGVNLLNLRDVSGVLITTKK